MPIRDFQFLKSFKNTFAKRPSRLLTNEKLIIDGSWFVRKYGVSIVNQGPFTELLKKFSETEIIWIWNGIKPKRAFYTDFAIATLVEVKKKNLKAANRHFTKFLECYDTETKEYINEELRRVGIKSMTAPYVAMAQAIYMQEKTSYYYFGPTDYLLFDGAEKLITEFYFDTDQIEIVYKNEICKGLKLNAQKFQELVLLFGSEFCPTVPMLCASFSGIKVLEMFSYLPIIELMRKRQDIDDDYLRKYVNALHYLRYCPVMTENGIQHLNTHTLHHEIKSKMKLEEVFGTRLKDDLYERMFTNEINPDVLELFVYAENREKDRFVDLAIGLLEADAPEALETTKENITQERTYKNNTKNTTFEDYIAEHLKLNITFIDNFPLSHQIVIYNFLTDKETRAIIDKIITAFSISKYNFLDLEEHVLEHFLRFIKQIHFCKLYIEIGKALCNLRYNHIEYNNTINYKLCALKFINANNRDDKYSSIIACINRSA